MKNSLLFVVLLLGACSSPKSDLKLFSLFQDHMVLQRDSVATIWGWASPGTEVDITAEWGATATAVSSPEGNWSTTMETGSAGGPYTLTIYAADTTIRINDVMLGEVWLASGQSNMEMPLAGWPPKDTINYSAEEIAQSNYPEIRMFTVTRALSEEPLQEVQGSWAVSNSENSPDFSATGYFFARTLYQAMEVPIGIIHSSWGGTPAEAWTSAESLETMDDFREILAQMELDQPERAKFQQWKESLEQVKMDGSATVEDWRSLTFNDEVMVNEETNDEAWPAMNLPMHWEQSELGSVDGVVWFRKSFELEEEMEDATLHLGAIDDRDQTYVNGVLIGEHMEPGVYQEQRNYSIPAGVLKQGENVVSVKVIDTGGGGGIYDAEVGMFVEGSSGQVDISGEWKYKLVAIYENSTFFLFTDDQLKAKPKVNTTVNSHTPTVLYNAMINPLVPYTIKGAIWYQGESNVGRAQQYEQLFPTMISDWRLKWDADFSFYFVQIAPFQYEANGTRSAALRDAQRKTLELDGTGMAVTMDIGNNTNIHPGNKQDVGYRLAAWALAKDYGVQLAFSGPLVRGVEVRDGEILLSFDFIGSGLDLKDDSGFEVSLDGETFIPVPALVVDDHVVLRYSRAEGVQAVRYGWRDTAKATLFNSVGLPASSFLLSTQETL